ncbi:J domain-containing protein OS=Sphingobium scionense OX=1404341 GN=GGQ90_002873 PE=4 SV=1 [Sphingobium scionense]
MEGRPRMSVDIAPGYPLDWPTARPRTAKPKPALFRHDGRSLTLTTAKRRLSEQLTAMTRSGQKWRTTDIILTCNIRYTASGARDQKLSRRDPDDAGVALYFDLDGRPHVLACDRWDTVQDNIAAIAAHIEALRGQERWGVADLQQAFAGHMALPRPSPWWEILQVARDATLAEIGAAYRAPAKSAHPNAGGDRAAWDRLSAAFEEAKKARATHP